MKRIKKHLAVIVAVLSAAVTANGYRPVSRFGRASVYAFSSGVFATELPLQVLAPQPVVLAALSRRSSSRARVLAWLLAGLSWLGLIGLHLAGRKAEQPLQAALDEGLGPDRRTDVDGVWPVPVTGAAAQPPGLVRSMRGRRDYANDCDISYGEYGSRNHLDIWRHPDLDRSGQAPVLLEVPGGAWMVGSKQGQAYPLMSHLAARGWVCVSINYRLSPRSTWPDHIVDVKRAIAWIKGHIAEYGGDPDWIAITGGSAGGQLSSLAALTPNNPAFQPGFTDVDTRVQAAVPFYGPYDFTRSDRTLQAQMVPMLERMVFKQHRSAFPDLFADASPISQVSPDAPPFFVLHGSNDSLVPVEQARLFTARLREVSTQPVAYAELPYAQHAFDSFGSPRTRHAVLAVEQFLAEVYTRSRIT